jgi:hypothetical protein
MGLKEEIRDGYTDANGLVSPHRCSPLEVNPSGNGVMYTGELMMMLALRGEIDFEDDESFVDAMRTCQVEPGLLKRGPGYRDQEGPDDYYGFAAGCVATDAITLADNVVDYGLANFGSFNNEDPGKWTWKSFLWRQPQLICALYAAADRAPIWIFPLRLYTAAVIATSCMLAPLEDTDARRLSWLLLHTMRRTSLLCRAAGWFWNRRLRKHYGPEGMRAVARVYYEAGHPFAKYWP